MAKLPKELNREDRVLDVPLTRREDDVARTIYVLCLWPDERNPLLGMPPNSPLGPVVVYTVGDGSDEPPAVARARLSVANKRPRYHGMVSLCRYQQSMCVRACHHVFVRPVTVQTMIRSPAPIVRQ